MRQLSSDLVRIFEEMESFEASGSVANTGTGARREGEHFERLIAQLWLAFRQTAEADGAHAELVASTAARQYAKLSVGPRCLFVPASASNGTCTTDVDPPRWLEVRFQVSDLIAGFPTQAAAIRNYAPTSGPYAGSQYPNIYHGLTTQFDDTLVLVDQNVLREKIMLEYKTAKSTAGRHIDGNAHERLSFQIMQYLEVATRYTRCSLAVIANGAFVRYRNKYHVNFHVQADRLSNFAWFRMEHACTQAEYSQFLTGLLDWLFRGTPRPVTGSA